MQREPAGQADFEALRPYLEAAEQAWAKVEALRDFNPNAKNELTARFFDVNQPAGHRPYIGAYSHLSNAMEHSEALWALLRSDHGMSPRAPWTLLRSIFENGFWAAWLLDPSDGLTRRIRGLRLDMYDWIERERWINSLPVDDEVKAQARRSPGTYETECEALGVGFSPRPTKPNVVDELPGLQLYARAGEAAPLFVSTWRSLSGLQHGLQWAVHGASNVERRFRTIGGHTVALTTKENAFDIAARMSYGLIIEAAQRHQRLSTEIVRAATD